MKAKNILWVVVPFLSNILCAQQLDLELARVDFWAPVIGTGWIRIKNDDDGSDLSGVGKTTAWSKPVNGTASKSPIAYVSGAVPRVSACFRKEGTNQICSNAENGTSTNIYVRGTVLSINGMLLPPKLLVNAGAVDVYEYPIEVMNQQLPPKLIRYFELFKIKWEYALTDGPDALWKEVGVSEHPLYVTLDTPKAPLSHHFLSLLHIGCKEGDGAENNAEMLTKVWAYFEQRQVKRANGQAMTYYGQWSGSILASTTAGLLKHKDGMCMAWTRLFLDVLKMQGLWEENTDNFIVVRPRNSDGLLVKTWSTNGTSGTSGNPSYPYKNIKGTPFYTNNNEYNWEYAEVSLSSALSSQNNNNPQSDFGQHIFASVNGILYDPSYGISYGSPQYTTVPTLSGTGTESVYTIPDLDNYGISAYYLRPDATFFNIQMNSINNNDFVYIYMSLNY